MKRRPMRIVLAAMVASAALVTTACTAGTPTDDDDALREVSVQLYQAPRGFNPLIPSIGPDHLLEQLHWDALTSVTATGEYGPRLAESWDVSEDGKTWTFHLRDDVKWSDGEPFTSEDVLFTYTLYANPASGSSNVGRYANVVGAAEFAAGTADSVEGFQAPDDTTFVIDLVAPNVALLVDLVAPIQFILPEHVISELPLDGLTDNPFWREPTVGIGPYVFDKWLTDDEIQLVANPEYRTDLGLDRVYARFLSTDVAMAQLETGELDYAQVSAADFDRMSGIDGITVHEAAGPGVMALHPALDTSNLKNPLVRQAMMYAIDRESLVNEVIAGHGKVVPSLIFGPDWAVPDDLIKYEYNPDKARDLLAQAGWDSKTEVRLQIVPGQRDRDTIMTIVAAQLQEVGMNAYVAQVEPAEQADSVANRTFGTIISAHGLFNVEPAAMNSRLMCSAIGGANLVRYCNEDLDALLEAGVATTDQAERQRIYTEAQHIFNKEVPILVLYSPDTLAATSDHLQGFELNSSMVDAFWNAADWTVAD